MGNLNGMADDIVNVRDFGATGDPNQDATEAVEAAIEAADGKTLYFPAGTYNLASWDKYDSPTLTAPTTIYGDGRDSVDIVAGSRFPLADIEADFTMRDLGFTNFGNVVMARQDASYDIDRVEISNIRLDDSSSLFEATTTIRENPNVQDDVVFGDGSLGDLVIRDVVADGHSDFHQDWMRFVKVYAPFDNVAITDVDVTNAINDVIYIGEELNSKTGSSTPEFPPEFGDVRISDATIDGVVSRDSGEIHGISLRYIHEAFIQNTKVHNLDHAGGGDLEAVYLKVGRFDIDGLDILDGTDAGSDGALSIKKGGGTIANSVIRQSSLEGQGIFIADPEFSMSNTAVENFDIGVNIKNPAGYEGPTTFTFTDSLIAARNPIRNESGDVDVDLRNTELKTIAGGNYEFSDDYGTESGDADSGSTGGGTAAAAAPVSDVELLEGESATLAGGAVIDDRHGGFSGTGYIDFGADPVDRATWTIDLAEAGSFDLAFGYANGGAAGRELVLEIDGRQVDTLPFDVTGGWSSWGTQNVTGTIDLDAGTHDITLRMDSTGGPNVDFLRLDRESPGTTRYEAEAAELRGPVVDDVHGGFSGSAYVDFQNASNDSVSWTVDAGSSGSYDLELLYALGANETRTAELRVNGNVVTSELDFTDTGAWDSWGSVTERVGLDAGSNTVELVATGDSGPNVDALDVMIA